MKWYLVLILICGLLLSLGCANEPDRLANDGSDSATTVATLIPTMEATMLPTTVVVTTESSNVATVIPSQISSSTPVATTPPVATIVPSVPTAVSSDDGKVYLETAVIFDIQTEAPGCFYDIPADIIYSPTQKHFVVIPACIEGDNQLFVFAVDGTGKTQVTGAWDYVNFSEVAWAEDGRSFTYTRINSCCLAPWEIPVEAPPPGQVRYVVATGEKVLVATPAPPTSFFQVINVDGDDTLAVRSGAGIENAKVGEIPHDGRGIKIIGAGEVVGQSYWVPIQYQSLTGWVNGAYLLVQQ